MNKSCNQLINIVFVTFALAILPIFNLSAQTSGGYPSDQETLNDGYEGASTEGEVIGDDGALIETGGLTPIRSLTIPNSIQFKAAAVCHDMFSDVYGIAAIFKVSTGGEKLYYIRVDGNSASGQYGEALT